MTSASRETDHLLSGKLAFTSNRRRSAPSLLFILLLIATCTVIVAICSLITTLQPTTIHELWQANLLQFTTTKKRLHQHQHSHRRYQATQFISFTINTMGGLASEGECDGLAVDPGKDVCYLGNPTNITEDLYHRMAIVQQVIDVIRLDMIKNDPEIDHSSSVLKIVMLPEFFLRGPNGAYSTTQLLGTENERAVLLEISDAMQNIIQHECFEDYLFVFGTVIFARSRSNDATVPWRNQGFANASEVMYWNFAPIFAGGVNVTRYVATKKYISTVDFLDRTHLPNPATSHMSAYDDLTEELRGLFQSRGTHLIRDNILDIDGLRIGIEICLDHRRGSLWSNLQQEMSRTNVHDEENMLVDVLLVTSAGMALERGPNPIRRGGVAYLTDGEASSAACVRARDDVTPYDPDKICRMDPGGIKHVPMYYRSQNQNRVNSSEFVQLSGCYDFLGKTDLLEGYYSIHQTQGCAYTLKLYGIDVYDEYAYYAPSIEIYPVIDLP